MSAELAIVGVACRFPGGVSELDSFWAALLSGRDLVTSVPDDRFPVSRFVRTGRSYTAAGGFLGDIPSFDAEFFQISPREASRLDPQQRLLLEMAVEAFDDAGLTHAALAGSRTGVFVGVSGMDYGELQHADSDSFNAYTMAGCAMGNTANRVSHFFDLRGPSMAIDTACSSSLVALHQAAQSLRCGETSAALACGINVLLSPYPFIGFSQASMLSPTGRCHAFSAAADGYVRAEGGGVLVLKRLDDALAGGDRVHAVLLGTGLNADGHTLGLGRPSAEAQAALVREVHDRAGVRPDDVVYFEAHGTGTSAGDPLECQAIGESIGRLRSPGHVLPIGSVKASTGHLEPAAGIAGLVKSILVLRNGIVPPTPHCTPLNPEIDFARLGIEPAARARTLERRERRAVAVNSFGFGGANAHAVLTDPPPCAPSPPVSGELPVVVSARSPQALQQAVTDWAARFEDAAPEELYDLCHTACLRRELHGHRVAAIGATGAQIAERLRSAEPVEAVQCQEVAFVFSGNGSAWAGMGTALLREEPAFAAAVHAADEALRPWLGRPVVDDLADAARLARTECAQPALFAVQTGLCAALRTHGLVPDVVLGHSVGEIAAAHVAGALDLDSAARLVVERSAAQALTAGAGRMAAAGLSRADAELLVRAYDGELELAAVNSPRDVTISGDAEALADLGRGLTARGVFFRRLDLDYAFHSRAMDGVEHRLLDGLSWLRPRSTRVPLVSTVTGSVVDGERLDASHWWHNIRRPVLFADAIARTTAGVYVEIGPRPVLLPYLRHLPARAIRVVDRENDDGPAVRAAVSAVIAAGGRIDWHHHFPRRGRVVSLPRYPWQREVHWNGSPQAWGRSAGAVEPDHPVLGERVPVAAPAWTGELDAPWLADHRVGGAVVVPFAAFAEVALAAGRRVFGGDVDVVELRVERPLVVDERARLQTSLWEETGLLHVTSRTGDGEWRTHARGRVRRRTGCARPEPVNGTTGAELIGRDEHYSRCAERGLDYGPAFQVLEELRIGPSRAVATFSFEGDTSGYEAHPAVVDGAIQATLALQSCGELFLPVAVDRLRAWGPVPASGRIRVRAVGDGLFDVVVSDHDGVVAVELAGCRMRRVPSAATPVERYVTVLRAAPEHRPVPPSPLPADFRPPLDDVLPASRHERAVERITALAGHLAARALTRLGSADFDALVAAGVDPKHRRAVAVLTRLAAGPHACFDSVLDEFPEYAAHITLVGRYGLRLAALLTGKRDPLQLSFTPDGADTIEHFYDHAPTNRFLNLMVRDVLADVVRRWPADRPLRVLEIGGGTGGVTATVMPVLPADRTRYVFTDISPAFFPSISARLTAFDFVDHQVLDLDGDPADQGFGAGCFDVVIAANVLHAAKDVRAALRRAAGLLGEGGLLVALEAHTLELLVPFTGMLDSFWDYTDTDLRGDSPLLPVERWTALLGECGFGDVARFGDRRGDTSLLLARRRGAPEVPQEPAVADSRTYILSGQIDDPVRAVAELRDRDVLVTHPCGALPDAATHPVHAVVWGAARTLVNEDPGLPLRRISFQRSEDAEADARTLADEVARPTDEDEVVLTPNGRFVPRLVRRAPRTAPASSSFQVEVRDKGPSFRLAWVPGQPAEPSRGQVRICVRAAGLNYRDVMWGTGMLPDEAVDDGYLGAVVGCECAGVVSAVGPGVTGFAPGDRVFAVAGGSLAADVVASADYVAHLPPTMTFTEGATIPLVFLTVHHALGHVARLSEGETVLVHSAAGGIGLAALQHARHVGARVVATAGTEEKRDVMRLLGVERVLDSRGTAFADQAGAVDVVLNSLTGEALTRGLDVLRPSGRFVELGKRDVYAGRPVSLRPLRHNVSVHVVDVDRLMVDDRALAGAQFAAVASLVRDGSYRPLPHRAYPAARIDEAFRLLRRSRHIGKVVVTFDESVPVERTGGLPALSPDGTYLVTGGTSGIGADVARWLVARGARHVALIGRRGGESVVDGARVYRADVADRDAMREVIDEIARSGRPLRGVVHAAGLADDAVFAELTEERWRAVLRPKLDGGLVLDELTSGLPLDFFVACSSLMATVGSVGQANYVAANLFLEGLARHRRSRGDAGQAIGWGVVGEVGFAARDGRVDRVAEDFGAPLSPAEVVASLGELLASPEDAAEVVTRTDWAHLHTLLHQLDAPRFAPVVPPHAETRPDETAGTEDVVVRLVADVLGADPDRLDRSRPLDRLGIDSLTGTELRVAIRRRLGIDLPAMAVPGGTITDLVRLVRRRRLDGKREPATWAHPRP